MNGLECKIQEYSNIQVALQNSSKTDDYWLQVKQLLNKDYDWTEEGAEHLINLVRSYGSFVLLNAAALADALEIEDGELGL